LTTGGRQDPEDQGPLGVKPRSPQGRLGGRGKRDTAASGTSGGDRDDRAGAGVTVNAGTQVAAEPRTADGPGANFTNSQFPQKNFSDMFLFVKLLAKICPKS
jgi:hypothetical protein